MDLNIDLGLGVKEGKDIREKDNKENESKSVFEISTKENHVNKQNSIKSQNQNNQNQNLNNSQHHIKEEKIDTTPKKKSSYMKDNLYLQNSDLLKSDIKSVEHEDTIRLGNYNLERSVEKNLDHD